VRNRTVGGRDNNTKECKTLLGGVNENLYIIPLSFLNTLNILHLLYSFILSISCSILKLITDSVSVY